MKPAHRLVAPAPAEPLAWLIRERLIESVHAGHMACLGGGGEVLFARGNVDAVIYPRSAAKPLQAVAMLRLGVELDDEQLALACSSHSGEPRHLEVARSILLGAGLSEADLRNTPDLPLNAEAAREWLAGGGAPSALTQCCSGKHAAMVATSAHAGLPTADYLRVSHPLQQVIGVTIADLTGVEPAHVAVDGCGAPLFSTTTRGLARAFGRIAAGVPGTPEGRVAAAMRAHPWLVAGTGRDATAAMESVPGLIAKDGVEGVFAGGLADGRGFAFKIADGGARPRAVIAGAALHQLGIEGRWAWAGNGAARDPRSGSVLPAFGPGAPDVAGATAPGTQAAAVPAVSAGGPAAAVPRAGEIGA